MPIEGSTEAKEITNLHTQACLINGSMQTVVEFHGVSGGIQ